MSVLVVGTVAFDSIETPSGSAERILGGSASYFALGASYFAPVRVVGVIGQDFPQDHLDLFTQRGIEVACVSVNDGFVMGAWGKAQNVPANLHLLADGNGEFARSLGLELDATGFGMGVRSKRFALYAEDGVVKQLFVEAPGEFKVSSAEHVLAHLA